MLFDRREIFSGVVTGSLSKIATPEFNCPTSSIFSSSGCVGKYESKVLDLFKRRSCLPSVCIESPIQVNWLKSNHWASIVSNPYGIEIEQLMDDAVKKMVFAIEREVFSSAFQKLKPFSSPGFVKELNSSCQSYADTMAIMDQFGKPKYFIVHKDLIGAFKILPGYQRPEQQLYDKDFCGKPNYFGYLDSNHGLYFSSGITAWNGSYNCVWMEEGSMSFGIRIDGTSFTPNNTKFSIMYTFTSDLLDISKIAFINLVG